MTYKAPKRDENGNKINTQGAKETYTDDEILEMLKAHNGNINETARYLGLAPSHLRHVVSSNPTLHAEYKEIRLAWIEKAQDYLYKELQKPNPKLWAINRALDSVAGKGLELGEVKNFKVDSENLNVNATITDEDLAKLSLEERKALEQYLTKLTDKESDS